MNKEHFTDWVKGYVQAWNSNQEDDIGRIFSEGALYFTSPFDEPWQGREAIIKGWLEIKDEPDNFRFEFEVLAFDGELGIVRGETHYFKPAKEYANIWLVKLNEQGQCKEYVEYCERK